MKCVPSPTHNSANIYLINFLDIQYKWSISFHLSTNGIPDIGLPYQSTRVDLAPPKIDFFEGFAKTLSLELMLFKNSFSNVQSQ